MITCDYCGEPIQNPISIGAIGHDPETERLHIDLHVECVAPFAVEAKKAKGKRPVKPTQYE